MPRQLLSRSLGLVLAGCLGACASGTVKPSNPAVVARLHSVDRAQKATVVVYRPAEFQGSALRPTVVMNGRDMVNIGNGRVFIGAVPPGHYAFEMDDKRSGTELDLKSGSELFMKVEIVPGFWKGGGKLTQVAPEQGTYEASRLQLIEPKEIEMPTLR